MFVWVTEWNQPLSQSQLFLFLILPESDLKRDVTARECAWSLPKNNVFTHTRPSQMIGKKLQIYTGSGSSTKKDRDTAG